MEISLINPISPLTPLSTQNSESSPSSKEETANDEETVSSSTSVEDSPMTTTPSTTTTLSTGIFTHSLSYTLSTSFSRIRLCECHIRFWHVERKGSSGFCQSALSQFWKQTFGARGRELRFIDLDIRVWLQREEQNNQGETRDWNYAHNRLQQGERRSHVKLRRRKHCIVWSWLCCTICPSYSQHQSKALVKPVWETRPARRNRFPPCPHPIWIGEIPRACVNCIGHRWLCSLLQFLWWVIWRLHNRWRNLHHLSHRLICFLLPTFVCLAVSLLSPLAVPLLPLQIKWKCKFWTTSNFSTFSVFWLTFRNFFFGQSVSVNHTSQKTKKITVVVLWKNATRQHKSSSTNYQRKFVIRNGFIQKK